MNTQNLPIEKLPKWAQEEIKSLNIQRKCAVKCLNEHLDNQTPSPFYIDDWVCTGEKSGPTIKRRYIQSHRVSVVHCGVELTILLRDDYIDLQWAGEKRTCQEVLFIPSSFQQARLKAIPEPPK